MWLDWDEIMKGNYKKKNSSKLSKNHTAAVESGNCQKSMMDDIWM